MCGLTEDTVRQLIRQVGTRRNTRVSEFVLCFCPQQSSWDRGSAARIVRAGILLWLAVLGGDNCQIGGPVQHPRFVGLAPAETQSVCVCLLLQSCSALLLLGSDHIIKALGFY
jgi:hypothetical protein